MSDTEHEPKAAATALPQLADKDCAAEYLSENLVDGDPVRFVLAMRNVIEVRGGVRQLAGSGNLDEAALGALLGGSRLEDLRLLQATLHELGMHLAVEAD